MEPEHETERDELSPRPPRMEHRAPPPDQRPRSKLAKWALLLSLALCLPAVFAGLWVLMIPAVLLSIWALLTVKPAVQKGHGLALAALLISLAGGSCSYMAVVGLRGTVGPIARGTLGALANESESQQLADWFVKPAIEDGVLDRVRARYAAVVETHGLFTGELMEESALMGGLPYTPPDLDSVREIGGMGEDEDEEPAREGQPLWARARFEKGVIRLEFVITQDGLAALQRVQMGQGQSEPPEVLEDLRFYVDR